MIETLLFAAFRSFHKFVLGIGFDTLVLLTVTPNNFFACLEFVPFFGLSFSLLGGDGAGSFTPSEINLTIGATST